MSRHQGVKEPPLCPDCGYTHREDNCPNAPSLQGVKVCNCTGRIFTTCGCEVHGLQGVKEPDRRYAEALARVDRLWRCTGCGYFAYSSPWGDLYGRDGEHVGGYQDLCPECGERCWHWCGGDSRVQRVRYAEEIGLV